MIRTLARSRLSKPLFVKMPVIDPPRQLSSTSTRKGDLFKYQAELPSLPVPDLQHTKDLYLRSIAPLYPGGTEDAAYVKYAEKVNDFFKQDGDATNLQLRLQNLASGERNWLSTWWNNYAYLEYRDPVSPFVSYFFSHRDVNSEICKDQLLKAAALTSEIVKFREKIETETLAPELVRGKPFCMESFKWMFNNSRIPLPQRDGSVKFDSSEHRYLTVLCQDRIYKVYHHDVEGNVLSPAEIHHQLYEVLIDARSKPKVVSPLGILTSANRDVWATAYAELQKSPVNLASLETIHASSFVLCLDDNVPVTIVEKSRNAWHGNGTNRWFDKPVEIFVARNGSSGFLGEHSLMDGTPTLSMNDHVASTVAKMKLEEFGGESQGRVQHWEELNFDITPATQTSITAQVSEFHKTVNGLDINVWQYPGLGKSLIKQFKCSPDAFIQMLIQLAYYKMTGISRPTYESASTRRFFGGRTEACRSVSLESLEFVRAWEDPSIPASVKVAKFRAAVDSHVSYITQASNGQGVDRHLFGLKQLYQPGESIHEIFTDPMYSYSSHWYLSTSQLSSEWFNGYGWSPVVPDGFGLAYMLNNEWMHVNITVFKDNSLGLRADAMAYYLSRAADELKELLSKEIPIKAKL
ncbi:unnamed protein product [Kuraishia capsulata CBS 1993]|uniref:Carnitine O-acetyltransferase, mitochondrial n=1 Tax=Kuraishia capsulata CBS 1993 TaxID=1382522 RepID=W6MJ68_9ASCO|nr:uncharacterized protein KUCA_T00000435001 [Kuraishia capsulata CBS 1993]CDK24472.1 unnamed protein product [Kuraishia capsulata CBS 1993]